MNDLPQPILKRSSITSTFPYHLQDYVCSQPYPLLAHVSYDQLSTFHKDFVFHLTASYEPQFDHQAIEYYKCRKAMVEELATLELNNTWSLVSLLHGKQVIGCRCIYKIKHKVDGSIDRYKARLVEKGYTQQASIKLYLFSYPCLC